MARGHSSEGGLWPTIGSITICELVSELVEVHAVPNKARHACERRRDGEAAVSRENAAGWLFQYPVKASWAFLEKRKEGRLTGVRGVRAYPV